SLSLSGLFPIGRSSLSFALSIMRILILTLLSVSVYAERDRTSCFNYIDCLEQAQLQFKNCAGGTAVALSLERRTKLMSEMLDDRRNVLEICQTNLRKESLDFDTLQSLVNEDSRECFQKIPFTPLQSIPKDCEYPLAPLPSREIPHGRCLGSFQKDRHQCEKLLRCCPEHNACAERMNALSIAYQIARKKSREISDRMMECISDETAKDNERRALIGEEETKEDEPVTFPTLSPTTPESIPTPRSTKKLWVPNKIVRLPKSIIGDIEPEVEEKEGEEETTTPSKPRRVKISEKIVPSSDGGMPFNRPDKAMRKRIEKRLQLTPSALLEKNREDFFNKFDKARKEKEAESIEKEVEESEEEEPKEDKKVAIVKFLLEKADAQTTERVITMLASGDLKGLMEIEKKEKRRRKDAILKALPAEPESEEIEEKMRKRVSIENVIKQTLEKVSSDHKEQKKALMKNIKSALVEQKQSMEKMVQVAKEREAKESQVTASPELISDVPSTTTTSSPEETTKLPETAHEIEKSILEKKEAKLSEELRQRIGLENEFRKMNGEETTTVETIVAQTEAEETTESSHKKLDIRPILDSDVTTTSRPIFDSDVPTEVPSTTLATVTIVKTLIDSESSRNVTRLHKKKRGKGSRHARRTKNGKKAEEPSDKFCLSYGECESLAWEYDQRCHKKFNPITVTFGIEDSQLRNLLLNNSKSDNSVVTQVCLRPVDKSVHNSVLQLQHIERGVRKACLSLGRDRPTLTKKEKDECRILSHFSVIEMEDWLEQTHGHTETNLAECQARTAAIAASCQELSSCCSAISPCEQYISSSPVRKMRVEAIQLLLAQQNDCENRMEKTLKQLHEHFRLRPARK
ncbi:hypothetical protein PRIPAC_90903, partial [Pristionchus pacificus]